MIDINGATIEGTSGYHPLIDDSVAIAASLRPARVLVLGARVPDVFDHADEARRIPSPDLALAPGVYWFDEGSVDLLLVTMPGAPMPPERVAAPAPEGSAIANAADWLHHLWPDATHVPIPLYRPQDPVVMAQTGQDAHVLRRTFRANGWFYTVRLDGSSREVGQESLLPPPVDDDPAEWVQRDASSADRFAATLTRAKLDSTFTDLVFSYRASRTIFKPYQFKPVMKMLSTGSDRLLIADEVGLGKTVEAGLVWTELEARKSADTVLIVCPSVLVSKWRREMDERFGFDLVELDRSSLEEMLEHLEAGRPKPRGSYVASLESLRSWDGLERANELGIHFDLVIVDEAHAFRNLGTKSNALGGLIADWSESLLLLSATPLNLRSSDLRNLLEILNPGEFGDAEALQEVLEPNAPLNEIVRSLFDGTSTNVDRRKILQSVLELRMGSLLAGRHEYTALRDLLHQESLDDRDKARVRRLVSELHGLSSAITRTRKVEVGDNVIREPQPLEVVWTPAEQRFYDEFVAWCRERARVTGTALNFSMQMPLRLVGSCLPMAVRDVLGWGQRLLVDEFDDLPPMTESQLIPPHEELVAAAREVGDVDSKIELLRPEIARLARESRQAIMFTFSRKTLGYLQQQFAGQSRVAVLHGGLNKRERHDVMTRFRAGDFDLVIATKVASEGLDFEFCSVVINYDLPWNPMEVEQRIGRIDRIGQREKKIHVVNLVTESAIEDDIMNRLLGRIKVFEQSIGDLEPILQSRITDLQQTLLNFELTPEERRTSAEQKLAAIEETEMTRSEVENASQYLLSSDGVDIDGLGQDLESTGRYVGQDELRLLLEDWAETLGARPGAVTAVDPQTVRVIGNAEMARSVRGLVARGYRSSLEVETVASALSAESPIYLSLDQEESRTGTVDLLTSNHPMVRAALMVPGHRNVRFAHLRVEAGRAVPVGSYLVVVATSQWQGVRPASELWTAAVDLTTYGEAPAQIGDLVLSRLAAARLSEGGSTSADLSYAVDVAKEHLLTRLAETRAVRERDNEALAATRRASVEQVRGRRRRLIESRIATLRRDDKTKVIPLHEAQLRRADVAAQAALNKIDEGAASDMSVEYLAVCTLEVI